ncbi:MAG: hypothetical protein R3B82_16560 [Sandaracinaceae bacterium]
MAHLDAKGLLTDGPVEAAVDDEEIDEDLLDVVVEGIPGWTLRCSGRGACCESFPTVQFSAREARRALVLLEDEPHDFYPQRGIPREGGAVAPVMIQGRCRYFDESRRCSLQARGGVEAKPAGCRAFPMQKIWDGETIRAGFTFECACVVDGIGLEGGEPPLPGGARILRDAPRIVPVGRVPEQVGLRGSEHASRAQVRRFYRDLAEQPAPADVASGLWAVGLALAKGGLEGAAAAYGRPPSVAVEEVRASLRELRRSVSAWREPLGTFRAPSDFTRVGLDWIVEAADRILDSDLPPPPGPETREAEVEAFYVVATSWGYADALGRVPLAHAFPIRALRVWLARAIAAAPPADPRAVEPLTVVEVLFRAVGLDSYAAPDLEVDP